MEMEEFKTKMMGYLPYHYKNSPQFNNLLGVYNSKLIELEANLEKINSNLVISTAVEMLDAHEKDLGITTIPLMNLDRRRELIISKYRSAFDQITEDAIIQIAKSFVNGEIEFLATEIPGLYTITFISELGVPYNIAGLQEAVRKVLPAHLDIKYLFMYNTWGEVGAITWGQAAAKTWHELRVWEGVS